VGAETEDDELEATVQAGEGDSPTGRVAYALRRVLIGPALRSTAIAEERIGRLLALAVLMLSVGLGYRQVVRAYPHGGGSYIVASDSLGRQWGLLAGAGLIVDYILTVAVSVASGVAAVTSAIPSVASATVPIGLVVIVLLVALSNPPVTDA
jgi:K+ transporter